MGGSQGRHARADLLTRSLTRRRSPRIPVTYIYEIRIYVYIIQENPAIHGNGSNFSLKSRKSIRKWPDLFLRDFWLQRSFFRTF